MHDSNPESDYSHTKPLSLLLLSLFLLLFFPPFLK